MAMKRSAIQKWISTLPGDPEIGVDEGGLCLRVVGDPDPYLEIGGIPVEDEENMPDNDKISKALMSFVSTVESTGGVVQREDGLHYPVADEEWIDVGEAYLEACEALGRDPKVERYTLEEEADDV